MFDPDTRDANAREALAAHIDEHEAISQCEAFTALAVTLSKAAHDDAEEMAAIMQAVDAELPAGRLSWIMENTDVPPAAWLQKRVREHTEERAAEAERGL